ncbi:MAG: DNA topoisomerase (ATP-hydrolyzing) subunit A [Spirochaetaceae bacterium]|jgi:DNA gyrase subunit A|nr:DNA topoisomerase (ATP-hydrolyzing) subunit A [Spirochaetaceae bacterium]
MPEESNTGRIIPVSIEEEVKNDYLTYAMSVIVARALPDVRDGLKPVHRRLLYSMDQLSLRPGGTTRKCATIVGETMGKYHPHGDAALYDALVRMGQDFSLRYPLVKGQGNFGSVDGDPPAAMRYTEAKLSRPGDEVLQDLHKDTVDFIDNFDATEKEPTVLPGAFPNLLVNGSDGIAVGMATKMPTHNLREVCDAICAYIDNTDITIEELMHYITGPDFPTGGVIFGRQGIRDAYMTGRGRILIRAKFKLETSKTGKETLVFYELPYGVKPKELTARMGELVKDKAIEGITYVNDESDKEGIRVIADLKKGAITKVVLNQLFAATQLQLGYSIINLALVDGKPQTLTLKELIQYFVAHRIDVVTRRTKFELRKAADRANILDGLVITLANIDEVIAILKAAADVDDAKQQLKERFLYPAANAKKDTIIALARTAEIFQPVVSTGSTTEGGSSTGGGAAEVELVETSTGKLNLRTVEELIDYRVEAQAQAIVDMRLARITHLEVEKIDNELKEITAQIEYLKGLLAEPQKLRDLIKTEIQEMRSRYGDERRTEIVAGEIENINIEDLIKKEEMMITISNLGYIKRVPVTSYKAQGRGGKGIQAAKLPEDDFVDRVFVASTHEYITFISNLGKAYWMKVHELPEGTRTSKGEHLKMLLQLTPNEEIAAIVACKEVNSDTFIVMATARGVVKKVCITEFGNAKTRGVTAIKLDDDDKLVAAIITGGKDELMLISRYGKALRYNENMIRPMGRTARGVTGMKISGGDELASLIRVEDNEKILIVTEYGYGKRVNFDEFSAHGRNTGGQRIYTVSERGGEIAGVVSVKEDEELMCITSQGMSIKVKVKDISVHGRAAGGVRIFRIEKPDFVVGIDKIVKEDAEEE